MRTLLFLLLVCCAPQLVAARPVVEDTGMFSVEIPDDWKYNDKEKMWQSHDDTCALMLSSVPEAKTNLQVWTERILQKHASAKASDQVLDQVAAKRVEFVTGGGSQTYLWLSTRDRQAAIMTLVHSRKTTADIPALTNGLQSSYKWLQARP